MLSIGLFDWYHVMAPGQQVALRIFKKHSSVFHIKIKCMELSDDV